MGGARDVCGCLSSALFAIFQQILPLIERAREGAQVIDEMVTFTLSFCCRWRPPPSERGSPPRSRAQTRRSGEEELLWPRLPDGPRWLL